MSAPRRLGLVVLLTASCMLSAIDSAGAELDYRSMIERIETLLTDAVASYRDGEVGAAQTAVKRAYFEVFENLEGPIRVNISARKNFELESEYTDFLKMILFGHPADAVDARMRAHLAELWRLLPTLEAGFRIRAEAPVGEDQDPSAEDTAPKRIDPHWVGVVDGIGQLLEAAAAAYEAGDAETARSLIAKAQVEGYRESRLGNAVRRFVSPRMDTEYDSEFVRIIGLIDAGRPARMVRASGVVMVADLSRSLPGLPLVGPAAPATAETAAP